LAKVACTHCQLEFDKSVMIKQQNGQTTLYFCCKGCEGVYHLLHSDGLDSFYEKRGSQTLTPAKAPDDDTAKFDLEGFHNKYVTTTKDGFSQINLVIEGIHCSACVWLNEKVLHKTDGIIDATINYSTNKAKITWNAEQIPLSKIITTIRSIGYNAYPYDPTLQENSAIKTRNDYYSRILVGVFGSMNIMWLAIAQYAGYFSGIDPKHKNILNIAEFVLATPVLFYSGWIFFRGAYYGLKNRFVNMDLLVISGALLAYIYSIYAMITHHGEVYFDSVAMIITFVLVGKYLEILSKKSASDTMDKIIGTMPTEATLIKDGSKSLMSIENIKVGDTLELKPGEKVALDGVVTTGSASFDESPLTGENEPIFKQVGDEILSGSICLDSLIRYKVTKPANQSLLHTITEILSDSITKKPRIEQLANTISGYFSVIILLIAIGTFVSWYLYNGDFEHALIVSISVIVIACPCALGLATPMATLIGVSKAAKRGILFKESRMLETMAKSTLLALDKTGTITEGKPHIVHAKILSGFNPEALLALTQSSNHPISKSISSYIATHYSESKKPIELSNIQNIQAKGVTATLNSTKIAGGSPTLMHELGIPCNIQSEHSIYVFAVDGKIVATFELSDQIRPDAKETIAKLKSKNIKLVMLTGDHQNSAKLVANQVGIDQVYYSLLPTDKAKYIEKFLSDSEIVVMAGDGINDAIALAKSNIAIAMGSGADIAIEVSDVVLLDSKLKALDDAYTISKRTFLAVKQNLTFSIIYNIITIPLAIMGYVTPLIAAISMSLSSLVVVINSFRIGFKDE